MIIYEGFLKSDDSRFLPYIKFQPLNSTFNTFKTSEFTQFHPKSILTATLKDGSIANFEERDPQSLQELTHFLEISEQSFGKWSLFQGLVLPERYAGRIKTLEVSSPGKLRFTDTREEIDLDLTTPYGHLIPIKSRTLNEQIQKLREKRPEYLAQIKNSEEKKKEESNALIRISQNFEDSNGNYNSTIILTGFLER